MKKFVFVIVVFLSAGLQSGIMASNDGPIDFFPIFIGDTITYPGSGHSPWHPAPARPVILPEAELLEGSIYFYPQVEYDVTLRIEDAFHTVVVEDEIHLYINDDNEYDVSTLPAGTYTLILGIAGREYEGEFTIED